MVFLTICAQNLSHFVPGFRFNLRVVLSFFIDIYLAIFLM